VKTARELYPDVEFECYDCVDVYQPILNELGEIVVQIDEDAYQGSTLVLYKGGNTFGYLCFGWGSCSVCDALRACKSYEDIQALMDRLYDDIRWFDSTKEAIQFILHHDWEGTYLDEKVYEPFISASLRALGQCKALENYEVPQ